MALGIDVFLVAGLFPPATPAQTLRATVAYAQAAERAGFDGVWLAEHHFISYGVCPSAVTLAALILGRTRRIAVGTAAAILSSRNPIALAEEAATLDATCGGRFRLGVARGGPWVDLAVFGSGLDRYERGFAEALDLLLAALDPDGGTVAGTGEFFRFPAVPIVPRPATRMPVWIAATSRSTVEEAAKRGLPVILGVQDDDAAKAELLRIHDHASRKAEQAGHRDEAGRKKDGAGHRDEAGREEDEASQWSEAGRPEDEAGQRGEAGHWEAGAGRVGRMSRARVPHASAHLAYVSDSRAEAEAEIREPLRRWLATTREYVRLDGSPPAHRDLDAYAERLMRTHALGSPDECVSRLVDAARVTGAQRLLLLVEAAGSPRRTIGNIRRLGREVLPALRRAADGIRGPTESV